MCNLGVCKVDACQGDPDIDARALFENSIEMVGSGCSSQLGEVEVVVETMEGCISRVEATGAVKTNT